MMSSFHFQKTVNYVGECRKYFLYYFGGERKPLTEMTERKAKMKDISEELKKVMSDILDERLTKTEEKSLFDEGFKPKKPTRKTAVMIALYKKAVSGDLSAIKEIRSIVSGITPDKDGEKVTIVDDIGIQNIGNSR